MQVVALKTPLVKEHDNLELIIKNSLDEFIASEQAGVFRQASSFDQSFTSNQPLSLNKSSSFSQNSGSNQPPNHPSSQSPTHPLENSVLAITSKIVSYAQGRLIAKSDLAKTDDQADKQEKQQLVIQEADEYLPSTYSKYNMMIAIKEHTLAVNAGIDESNASGKYVLWPENLQASTNQIWQFVRQTYNLQNFGVILTDSHTSPLRWGVVGTCLAHCGFLQLRDYRGSKDLHDREIHMVQVNVAEALAVACALEMGEVAEQTPLAIARNIQHIQFQDRPPTQQELANLYIDRQDDVYGPFLNAVEWRKK